MKNPKIELTTIKQVKKEGTATVWLEESKTVESVTLDQHDKATNEDTVKWFRRLGGSESVTKNYTYEGYVVTDLVSTNPDKTKRTIRNYKFNK